MITKFVCMPINNSENDFDRKKNSTHVQVLLETVCVTYQILSPHLKTTCASIICTGSE